MEEVKEVNYNEEVKSFIKILSTDSSYQDVYDYFVNTDEFYAKYNRHLYAYIRISTKTHQDFGRQLTQLYTYLKEKDLKICIDNIYCDKHTGKQLENRKNYKVMRDKLVENDYIIMSDLSRLGRNWDDIKKEWNYYKYENYNILIIDKSVSPFLSSTLPDEPEEETLSRKFMQDLIFSVMLYGACMKIEEVKTSTKAGLEMAKAKGIVMGRPAGYYTTKENFIKTLDLIVNSGLPKERVYHKTHYPKSTFRKELIKYKELYKTEDEKTLLTILKKESEKNA